MRSPPDPFALLSPQLSEIRLSVLTLLESGHPALSEVARYYFQHPSKQIRPLIVFLFSRATNGLGQQWDKKLWDATCPGARGGKAEIDKPLSRPDVLNDWNPHMPELTANFTPDFLMGETKSYRQPVPKYQPTAVTTDGGPTLFSPTYILPTQMRLAEIAEMIHTASLLHDDVIDASSLRRGFPSAPAAFGSKLAILGGNFVLGRATVALSRLGDCEGTNVITLAISNLVEGELLQMNEMKMGTDRDGQQWEPNKDAWCTYLQKTYMKTASLIAKSARAAVMLGGSQEGDVWPEIAYAYGRNLGIAFQVCGDLLFTSHILDLPGTFLELQLVDDILDYESASAALGKPSGADLQLGLVTCPALYAWEEHPGMGELIQRKFQGPGDAELVGTSVSNNRQPS